MNLPYILTHLCQNGVSGWRSLEESDSLFKVCWAKGSANLHLTSPYFTPLHFASPYFTLLHPTSPGLHFVFQIGAGHPIREVPKYLAGKSPEIFGGSSSQRFHWDPLGSFSNLVKFSQCLRTNPNILLAKAAGALKKCSRAG